MLRMIVNESYNQPVPAYFSCCKTGTRKKTVNIFAAIQNCVKFICAYKSKLFSIKKIFEKHLFILYCRNKIPDTFSRKS